MNVRELIKKLFNFITPKIVEHFEQYEMHDKVYRLGGYILAVWMAIMVIAMVLFPDLIITHSKYYIGNIFNYLLMGIFSIAVALEYYLLFKKLYDNKWLFWMINGLIGIIANALAEIYTGHTINSFVGVDPSFFPLASSILMILSTIIIVIFIAIIILFFYMFIALFTSMISQLNMKNDMFSSMKIIIGKPLGLIGLVILLYTILVFFQGPTINNFSKQVIIVSEFYDKSHCKEEESKELYAEMNKGLVSIYNPDTKKFRVEKCK